MIDGGFLMLNSLMNMWWGISIFYSMSTEHCPDDFFWTFLGAFVFCLGIVQIIYFFIFPGINGDILNKPIGGKGKSLTATELLVLFRESYEKGKNPSNFN